MVDRQDLTLCDATLQYLPAIWTIKSRAFARYINFTPFIAPESIRLMELFLNQKERPIRVALADQKPVGYWMGAQTESHLHLSYIAVDPQHVNQGVGNLLLGDFEVSARARNIDASLDVFRSNGAVYSWYNENGYVEKSSSISCIVDLKECPGSGQFSFIENELTSALALESRQGCSVLSGSINSGTVKLGLTGGHYLRAMVMGECTVPEFCSALKQPCFGPRLGVIFNGLVDTPTMLTLSALEHSIRMEKRLHA